MSSTKTKLSDFLDLNRLDENLISSIYDECSEQEMESMYILDLEKDQAARCSYPINVLKQKNADTPVTIISLHELVDTVVSEVYQGYDSRRVMRSFSKARLKRKLTETTMYQFIARKKMADTRMGVIMFSFIPLEETHNLILLDSKEITSTLEYDILTGGRNRIGFFHLMQDILKESKPSDKFSMIFCNIQSFHHINVLHGMGAGDAVLQHLYTTLGYSNLTPLAYSRVETDHFYALVPRQAVTKENLFSLFRQEAAYKEKIIPYHCIFGIYHLTNLSESPASMCAKANVAANFVKDPFNQPWQVFDEELSKRYISDSEVIDRLDQALANREFVPYYQPIVNVRTGRIAMAEALARWISPDFGFVSPGYFIPSLEKHGGISRVDMDITNQVFDMLRQRMRASKHVVPIDVNVSWVDFGDINYVNNLIDHLKDKEVTTDMCRYEITETTIAELSEGNTKIIDIFSKHNAKLLIDDFGQGYSFSSMRDIDFYIVKLDKSLIDKLGTSRKADLLVDTFIGMFHKMGAKVVAEGVEKLQQVEYLRRVGCDYIQGFYFYRPMPEEQFLALLDKEANAKDEIQDKSPEQVWVEREVLEAQYSQMKRSNEEAACLKTLLDREQIFVFEWDIKTHIDTCPDSFVKLYNLPSNEVPNMPENADLCHPKDRDRFRNLYYRAEKGERSGFDYIRIINPDGKSYSWFRKTFNTIFDHDNKPYKVILAMQNCSADYKNQALFTRNDLLVRQQGVITFSYITENDTVELSFLNSDNNVCQKVLDNVLESADNEGISNDHRIVANMVREILATKKSGYIDLWSDFFGMELRAHYAIVESEYGNIYAIVGQAEDINRTREKLNSTIASQKSLLSMTEGLSSIYNAVSTLNLVDGSSRVILLSNEHRGTLSNDMDWETLRTTYACELLKPIYSNAFLKFTDPNTICERIGDHPYISLEYEDKENGWIRGIIMPSGYGENGEITSILFASMPINSEKENIDRLVYLAETDSLTGIRNRFSGEAKIDKAIAEQRSGIFAIIDCDKFKKVNDTFGHIVGDKYLTKVASCLNDSNPNGITMRLGGDEFALFVYGEYDQEGMQSFFDSLFKSIRKLKIEEMNNQPISLSVGAVFYDGKENVNFDILYRKADALLYISKKTEGCKLTI